MRPATSGALGVRDRRRADNSLEHASTRRRVLQQLATQRGAHSDLPSTQTTGSSRLDSAHSADIEGCAPWWRRVVEDQDFRRHIASIITHRIRAAAAARAHEAKAAPQIVVLEPSCWDPHDRKNRHAGDGLTYTWLSGFPPRGYVVIAPTSHTPDAAPARVDASLFNVFERSSEPQSGDSLSALEGTSCTAPSVTLEERSGNFTPGTVTLATLERAVGISGAGEKQQQQQRQGEGEGGGEAGAHVASNHNNNNNNNNKRNNAAPHRFLGVLRESHRLLRWKMLCAAVHDHVTTAAPRSFPSDFLSGVPRFPSLSTEARNHMGATISARMHSRGGTPRPRRDVGGDGGDGVRREGLVGYWRSDISGARYELLKGSRLCRDALLRIFELLEKDVNGRVTKLAFVVFALDLTHLFMPSFCAGDNITLAEDEWVCRGTRDKPDFSSFHRFFFDFPLMLCRSEHVSEELYADFWGFVEQKVFVEGVRNQDQYERHVVSATLLSQDPKIRAAPPSRQPLMLHRRAEQVEARRRNERKLRVDGAASALRRQSPAADASAASLWLSERSGSSVTPASPSPTLPLLVEDGKQVAFLSHEFQTRRERIAKQRAEVEASRRRMDEARQKILTSNKTSAFALYEEVYTIPQTCKDELDDLLDWCSDISDGDFDENQESMRQRYLIAHEQKSARQRRTGKSRHASVAPVQEDSLAKEHVAQHGGAYSLSRSRSRPPSATTADDNRHTGESPFDEFSNDELEWMLGGGPHGKRRRSSVFGGPHARSSRRGTQTSLQQAKQQQEQEQPAQLSMERRQELRERERCRVQQLAEGMLPPDLKINDGVVDAVIRASHAHQRYNLFSFKVEAARRAQLVAPVRSPGARRRLPVHPYCPESAAAASSSQAAGRMDPDEHVHRTSEDAGMAKKPAPVLVEGVRSGRTQRPHSASYMHAALVQAPFATSEDLKVALREASAVKPQLRKAQHSNLPAVVPVASAHCGGCGTGEDKEGSSPLRLGEAATATATATTVDQPAVASESSSHRSEAEGGPRATAGEGRREQEGEAGRPRHVPKASGLRAARYTNRAAHVGHLTSPALSARERFRRRRELRELHATRNAEEAALEREERRVAMFGGTPRGPLSLHTALVEKALEIASGADDAAGGPRGRSPRHPTLGLVRLLQQTEAGEREEWERLVRDPQKLREAQQQYLGSLVALVPRPPSAAAREENATGGHHPTSTDRRPVTLTPRTRTNLLLGLAGKPVS